MDELIARIREGCPERGIPDVRTMEYDDATNTTTMLWLGVSLNVVENGSTLDVVDPRENNTVLSVPSVEAELVDIAPVFPYLWERVAYHCSKPIPIPGVERIRTRSRRARKTV